MKTTLEKTESETESLARKIRIATTYHNGRRLNHLENLKDDLQEKQFAESLKKVTIKKI